MHILVTNFNGNPNIGSFAFANDKFCLLARDIPKNIVKKIEKVLKVPVYQISICGSNLIGVFVQGNNKKILVPGIAFDHELLALESLGIEYEIINTDKTALGNNILCNDNGIIISNEFSKEDKKAIEKALGMKSIQKNLGGLHVPGSLCVVNNKYGIVNPGLSDEEITLIEKTLKVELTTGTVNMGNPFPGLGIVCNSYGFLISSASGGPEIANVDEALGFVKIK